MLYYKQIAMLLYDPRYFPIYLFLTPATIILNVIFKKIRPILFLLFYTIVHLFLIALFIHYKYHGGGIDFEFAVVSFFQMFIGIFFISISICFNNYQWAKKYWWFIGSLLLAGIYLVIKTLNGITR